MVSILENRARSADLSAHNYYDLLYSIHVSRNNFRRGKFVIQIYQYICSYFILIKFFFIINFSQTRTHMMIICDTWIDGVLQGYFEVRVLKQLCPKKNWPHSNLLS